MSYNLDIIIEIGTPVQRAQIQRELVIFTEVVKRSDPPLNISKVVIPFDFDAKVNELQGTTTYKSVRGVMGVAKILDLDNSIAVVLSPHLYTENQDTQTRVFIFLHEITHVSNRRKFPAVSSDSYSQQTYLGNIYVLFDEYVSDRLAFKIIDGLFPEKTHHWKTFVQNYAEGFTSLVNDAHYYSTIKSEIESFRMHGYVMLFLKNSCPMFDDVVLSIVHAFSLADHDPCAIQLTDLMQSPFVNEKTLVLMRFFKDKYQEGVFDVHDGINLITDFMTNFGMKFEDTPQGRYCHVLDI